jgi:hypothetical protein
VITEAKSLCYLEIRVFLVLMADLVAAGERIFFFPVLIGRCIISGNYYRLSTVLMDGLS